MVQGEGTKGEKGKALPYKRMPANKYRRNNKIKILSFYNSQYNYWFKEESSVNTKTSEWKAVGK